jgi:hypothetical protein
MNEGTTIISTPVSRRLVMASWAGMGAAALIGAKLASAKESIPTIGDRDDDETCSSDDRRAEMEANAAARYATFLASMADTLGAADTASVDRAIRDALKAVVDETLAAGDISANFATERKAAIDAAIVPIAIGGGSFLRGGRDGRMGRDGCKPGEMTSDDSSTEEPSEESTPTT